MTPPARIPLAQWAAQHGVSPSWARRLAAAGRVSGAVKKGRDWWVTTTPGGFVPLGEWAQAAELDPSHARRLARAGQLEGAEKRGRDWWIAKDTPYRRQRSKSR